MAIRFGSSEDPQALFHLQRVLSRLGPERAVRGEWIDAPDPDGAFGDPQPAGPLVRVIAAGHLDAVVLPACSLPLRPADELGWCPVLERLDSQTVGVTPDSPATPLRDLPRGSGVGCATPREAALLAALHPNLVPVVHRDGARGALASVADGTLAAALAPAWVAGQFAGPRMGIEVLNRIIWVPRPGEGACALIYDRSRTDLAELVEELAHPATAGEVRAELAFREAVEAPPETVVAASAISYGPGLRLKGLLLDQSGTRAVHADRTGRLDAPEPLGWAVAADVVRQAAEVLA